MKKIMHWALLLAFVVLAANCGASREQIHTQSITVCEGIFCEVNTSDGPPPGYADVVIKASLKTHLPGEGTLLESGNCLHGRDVLPFRHKYRRPGGHLESPRPTGEHLVGERPAFAR